MAENSAATEESLSLCGLVTQVVAMLTVVMLYLSTAGYGKSFSRSLMCLDLSHFTFLLLIIILFNHTVTVTAWDCRAALAVNELD